MRAPLAPLALSSCLQWRCRSLESWMGLLRFLRPRMPAIHTLRLRLAANVPTRRRRRLASRVAAAWATLADRLAAAAALEELSVVWDVGSCSCSSWLRVLYPPLDTATLLPALPRLARRGGRPPPLPRLRCLELSCESGVTLSAALALLPNLQQLSIGPGGYSCSEGTLLPACRRAPAVPACLPATLTALVLSGPWAATSLACCPDLADALPCLRELRMPISTAQFPAYSPGRFLKALLPLAGQLEVGHRVCAVCWAWEGAHVHASIPARDSLQQAPHQPPMPKPRCSPARLPTLPLVHSTCHAVLGAASTCAATCGVPIHRAADAGRKSGASGGCPGGVGRHPFQPQASHRSHLHRLPGACML